MRIGFQNSKFYLGFIVLALGLVVFPGKSFSQSCEPAGPAEFLYPYAVDKAGYGGYANVHRVADLNNDGLNDIVAGGVSVYLNRGHRHFSDPNRYLHASSIAESRPEVSDINGDGYLDILVPNGMEGAGILYNNGDGTFADLINVPVLGMDPTALIPVDLNSDGFDDLVVIKVNSSLSEQSSSILMLLNNGAGAFLPSGWTFIDSPVFGTPNGITDVDGDGANDLVLSQAGVRICEGDGCFYENFGLRILYGDGFGGILDELLIPTAERPGEHSVADMNLDGFDDVVVIQEGEQYGDFNLAIYSGNEIGTFSLPILRSMDGYSRYLNTGDIDLDGDPDVLVHETQATAIYENQAGVLQDPRDIPLDIMGAGLALGDVDGDGDFDFVYDAVNAKHLRISLNTIISDCNKNGTPDYLDICNGTSSDCNFNDVPDECDSELTVALEQIPLEFDGSRAVAGPGGLGDLDDDGDLDVLVAHYSKDFSIAINDGAGVLTMGPLFETDSYVEDFGSGDINGDGRDDIVLFQKRLDSPYRRDLLVYVATGPGNFAGPTVIGENLYLPTGLELIDFDQDGDLDLLYHSNQSSIQLRKNDGAGNFSTEKGLAGGFEFDVVHLDGDQDLDIMSSDLWGSDLIVGINNDSTPLDQTRYSAGVTHPDWIRAIDLDGDNLKDFVFGSSYFGNRLTFRPMQADYSPGTPINYGALAPFRSLLFDDFNNDSLPDALYLQKSYNRRIVLHLSSGLGRNHPFEVNPIHLYAADPSSAVIDNLLKGDMNSDGTPDLVGFAVYPEWKVITMLTRHVPKGDLSECSQVEHATGDLNCDGLINFQDINPLLDAFKGEAYYELYFPHCRWLNGDTNGDSLVNFQDVPGFLDLLHGGN